MISDSLSGVTFISVPGSVSTAHFSYLQVVMGYFVGYFIIAQVLLPLYYNRKLTSIYTYLLERYGEFAQKTGSFFFLLSRMLGAAARLYLTASVIQLFVFDAMGVPFWLSVSIIIILILLYTYKGGIKTLVWTDTFQSAFLLLGVVLSIAAISHELGFGFKEMVSAVSNSNMTETFYWDWHSKSFFPKQFLGGIFIAIAMTGLDQNMMQKNLSINTLKDSQKNMRWFSLVMVIVNVFFLSLGVLLYVYANAKGISVDKTDFLFPTLALSHLGTFAGVVFIVGLTAATFSSADSVLTTLTTSFMIDFLKKGDKDENENEIKNTRHMVHVAFAVILLGVILLFRAMNEQAIIDTVLMLAGYTYGPLLGLFFFGIFSKRNVKDKLIPLICILSPLVCYLLNLYSKEILGGYIFGNELLIVNGLITCLGLWAIPKKM